MFENKAFYIEMTDKKGTEPSQPLNMEQSAKDLAKLVVVTGSALIIVNGLMRILVNMTNPK